MNTYLNTTSLPNKIILYLSNLKKEFPKFNKGNIKVEHYKTQNINSAVTDSQDIIIYRKEELLKSILHELVHYHNMDCKDFPYKIVNSITSNHQVSQNNKYHISESITELLTTLFNSAFIQKYQEKSLDTKIKHYNSILLKEMIHTSIQSAKIIKYLSYLNMEDFCKMNKNKNYQNLPVLHQDSCVFSYYILKLYLFNNLHKFINKFRNYDDKLIINSNNESYKYLHNLFENSRKNNDLHKYINNIIKIVNNDKGLRMTAHILE